MYAYIAGAEPLDEFCVCLHTQREQREERRERTDRREGEREKRQKREGDLPRV
jgi:hypothetical protein